MYNITIVWNKNVKILTYLIDLKYIYISLILCINYLNKMLSLNVYALISLRVYMFYITHMITKTFL